MTSNAGVSTRYVNTYHHNNSLLFQFILSEFLAAFEEIQAMNSLCNRKPLTIPAGMTEPKQIDDISQLIEASLNKLVGSSRDYMRLFCWNFNEGIVSRLKTYCALFSQNIANDEKELLAMQHYADKVWQNCLHGIDMLYESSDEFSPLFAAVEKAHSAMLRFAKLIARVIQQFRDDENVIFFVLRNKEQFDKLYGKRFVVKLFCRIYAKGLREVQQFLSKKYSARSFDLSPIIATNIAELEASAL